MDYTGKIISKTQGQPTQASASGVWTLDEAAAAVKNNSWPIPGVPNPISKSLRFNSADSAYLNRTPGAAGNRKTWTWSGWVKRSGLGVTQTLFAAYTGVGTDTNLFSFLFNSSNQISIDAFTLNWRVTSAVYRDVSSWYHIVLAFDTTQSTASNRIKLYVNGTQVTAFGTSNDPTQNTDYVINSTNPHYIGVNAFNVSSNYGNYYMTEVNFIDGQALDATSFGQTNANTGVWEPKPYTGTYGTNGFYLNFKDSATTTALGYDYSGNGNNWTPNNFSVTAGAGNDSLVDVPTQWIGYNTSGDTGGIWRGNYATFNPLNSQIVAGTIAALLENGNLTLNSTATTNWYINSKSTLAASSFSNYCEMTVTTQSNSNGLIGIGVGNSTANIATGAGSYITYRQNGEIREYPGNVLKATVSTYTQGDVIGMTIDSTNVKFYKNNTLQGTYAHGYTGDYFVVGMAYNNGGTVVLDFNFGQRPFAYTPPAGYVSLCTTNLPTPTIGATSTTQAGKYFNTVLYTGTGSSLSVTGVGFQPDFVWIKERAGAADHGLYDAVRGVQKQLESNTTDAETTETTGLTAFNSDGFTVGALAQLNTNTDTYVSWNWKANGAGSSNTAGSISSTVSANTTAGFSIVTYTGTGANATVGHGCLVNNVATAPSMIIVKRRDAATSWRVYHASIGNTGAVYLNQTVGTETNSVFWNNTSPTSSVFTVGTDPGVNASSNTFVAYCFAPVAGYSAFGSYTGNGSTDGVFVYTGFRPRYILVKSSSNAYQWSVHDTARQTYNEDERILSPNSSSAEDTNAAYGVDVLSNGFKWRNSGEAFNFSGYTYIYAAFAESPFKYALAR